MVELELSWGGKTRLLSLMDGEHAIGRASDNPVHVPEPRVSKRHAILRIEGNRIFVKDLGSTNGTELDGKPISREELEVPMDSTIRLPGATLRRANARMKSPTTFAGGEVTSSISYKAADGLSDAARDRIVDINAGLFELLASNEETEEVETAACRFVSQCVAADRVVLLEDSGEATKVQARARWTKVNDDAPLRLSSTIVGQVLSQRESVLVANPLSDPNFGGQQSIVDLNLRSAMAAPLFDNERVRGILYVDTANPTVQYTQEDLEVLTATSNAVGIKLRNQTLERELRTAARIQKAMVPETLDPPEGFEVEAYQVMCREVGGDLYHCLPRPDGKVLVALGDVTGKGMPAALVMSASIVLVRLLAEIGGDLDVLVGHMHRQLFQSLAPEQYLTLFVAELDPKTGAMRYVNAGQDPPILVRADGSLETLESTGMPVAMLPEMMATVAEGHLHPGDLLVAFTDGIPEATTDGENFLGIEPVEEILGAMHRDPLPTIRQTIIERVETFLAGETSSDDVTLLLLRRDV